jgi:curved DNA-binding protein
LNVPEYDAEGMPRRAPKTITVRIPKGATDGQKLRVPGKGGPGVNGGPAGALYIDIKLRPHPLFQPSGHDLYLEVPVTPWEATLGTSIEAPTLDGKVRLQIAAGATAGQKLRLAGKGLPKPGGGHGDLYAVVQVVTPSEVNARERALYEELGRISSFNPRSHFDRS